MQILPFLLDESFVANILFLSLHLKRKYALEDWGATFFQIFGYYS
jgi:hypothetical protein